MANHLIISFGNHRLNFTVESTPIASLWLDRMEKRHQWPLDDPHRFYHFNSTEQEVILAEKSLRDCIDTINAYQPIVERCFTSVYDQDLLNYLHNIFERYHGMLDQQDHKFWIHAPDQVRKALADLNLAVHRCEYLSNGRPRIICTWFGMPKTERLDPELQRRYGRLDCEFGAVYLNYVEIGKTAQDLARDNDIYLADEMFQPFTHYSADFLVTFYNQPAGDMRSVLQSIDRYWQNNRDFFQKFGINASNDTRMMPFRFKVAQLQYTSGHEHAIIDMIRQNQIVTSVEIA